MAPDGAIEERVRVATPHGLEPLLVELAKIVAGLESEPGAGRVGICTPGAVSPHTGLIKNSNSTFLNGTPLHRRLEETLEREVRIANDANCLAVSEAADGAAAGAQMVFGVIIGTGAGGGVALGGRPLLGANAIGGEWGHVALPWMTPEEHPGPDCYCGKRGCNETFISGTGLERDYAAASGQKRTGEEIVAAAEAGEAEAEAALVRYESRLARGLLSVVHVLDPDVIVLGGGMSNVERLYGSVPHLMAEQVFGGDFTTPVLRARHGATSGVRGAAWLWPVEEI